MVMMATHDDHRSARQSTGPRPTRWSVALARPEPPLAKTAPKTNVDAVIGVMNGSSTPMRRRVCIRSLRLSRAASIRATMICGPLESTNRPKELPRARQKSVSSSSFLKFSRPAKPSFSDSMRL
jgi:hypothetical protein